MFEYPVSNLKILFYKHSLITKITHYLVSLWYHYLHNTYTFDTRTKASSKTPYFKVFKELIFLGTQIKLVPLVIKVLSGLFVCLFLWTPSFEGIRYPDWDFAYIRGWRRR